MVIAGLILTGLAALVHVYIFVLESLAWSGRRAQATFGHTADQVEVTKALAYNQGFYNLFLAIAVFLGTIFMTAGQTAIGATLVFTGAGSMVAAALVLLLSNRTMASAVLKQGAIPALGIIALVLGLAF
ncbi:DUF1304 domain-containing protein [Citricoccus muralis]|uniref:DUF1304 domain-containing protein n=1 Tax=Citricoccus muralis TaxID=169134 RepID=A0ABY8H9W4_9MICC|nr:DUF1304 domain-containing protein [Citricoccus muralis]WFP17418.1 DUF1304 domain-containing protein [Citricoccus muralis]